jgi:hypothetical protein
MERLRRVLLLMQGLELPEPTAYALTLTEFATPAAVRRARWSRLRATLELLAPLGDPFVGMPIRIDAVEATRA